MKINVGLYGMDKRCSDRMMTVFKMVYKGQCVATDVEVADTVVIDLEDKDINAEWQAFREKFPDKPAIVMSKDPVQIDGAVYIAKPAKLPELLHALKTTSNKNISTELNANPNYQTHEIAERLQQRIGSQQKPKRESAVSTSGMYEIFYKPNKFLQGRIIEAIEKANSRNESVFIRCWSDRWIVISPSSEYLFENIKDNQLKNLGLVNLEEDVIYHEEPLSFAQVKEMANTPVGEVKSTRIDKFVWDLTVRTSRGRIPEGTSLDEHYVLKRWPNLTRLSSIPNAMRISAFWLDQPQSVNDVANKLGVSIENVLTFFSAATAAGLLVNAKRSEDTLVKPEVMVESKNKSRIFSAILKKLTKNTPVGENAA